MDGQKFRPFLLAGGIVLLDQITKLIIVLTIPLNTVGLSLGKDLFRIIHVRNLGMAFSIGDSMIAPLRIAIVIIIPIMLIIALIVSLIRLNAFSNMQRWLIAGIIGGGIGNVFCDRVFRPLGVVDFLDFKFFGIFGLERWPTFNIADMSGVICSVLLIITFFFPKRSNNESGQQENE